MSLLVETEFYLGEKMLSLRINWLLILISVVLFLVDFGVTGDLEEKCDVKGKPGKCIPVGICPAVLGELSSGISPQMCQPKKAKRSVEMPSVSVCCPTKPKISADWCQEYKEVLMEPLVLDGNKKGPMTVKCETFLSPFISGGRNAAPREYPHQVGLGYAEGNNTFAWKCGGTLISDQYVLTAGHCVSKDNKSGLPKKILLGDNVLSGNESVRQIVDIAGIIPHPEYKPPIVYNDIALIKMQYKVNLSRSVLPACMPQPDDRLDKIPHVTATGWGQIGALESQSDTLQTVDLTKFPLKNCSSYFEDDSAMKLRLPYGIVRSQICAGDMYGIKDTCRGDSGGPITVNKAEQCVYYVVGVTSFGNNYCGYQQPGVYTNVLRYLEWIETVVWDGKPPTPDRPKNPEGILYFNYPTTTPSPATTTPTAPADKNASVLFLTLTPDTTEPSKASTTQVPTTTPKSVSQSSSTNSPGPSVSSNPTHPPSTTAATTTTTLRIEKTTTVSSGVTTSTPKSFPSIDEMTNKFVNMKKVLDPTQMKELADGYRIPTIDETSLTRVASNKSIQGMIANALFG